MTTELLEMDEHFMGEAIREARLAFSKGEVPVGCVVVVNGKVIARGHNQVELLRDASAHAEMISLTSAFNALGTKYVPDATVYITLEPCIMCCGALYWGKVKRIVYGATDEKNGYKRLVRKSPFHQKATITEGVRSAECASLMRDFFKQLRSKPLLPEDIP